MAEKIKLLNNALIAFGNSGVNVSYYGDTLNVPYINPTGFGYFSLIILTAKESSLDRARKIITEYEELIPIREIIIVGNLSQKLENIQTAKQVKFFVHKKRKTPIITSVKEALSCISNFSQFAVICPANKMFIEKDKLEKMLKTVKNSNIKFAVPLVNGKRTHPVVISKGGFEGIKAVRKELGFRHISKKLFKEVVL